MKGLHLFCTFLKHSLNKKLCFCVLLTTLIMSGTVSGLMNEDSSVWYLLDKSLVGSGVVSLLICVVPILPFAASLAEEFETNSIRSFTIRTGTGMYLLNKIIVSFLNGFIVMLLSQLLFILIFINFFPVFTQPHTYYAYEQLMMDGKVFQGMALFTIHMSLSGSLMAVMAVFVSTIIPNRFAAISVPVILYFTLSRIFPATANIPKFMIPSYLVECPVGMKDPMMEIMCKWMVVSVLAILAFVFGYIALRRRISNA